MIIAFGLEVYMARSGYKAFKMRIQFSWVSMHSFSFLFLSMYGFLTLYPNGMKINEFLQQYPRWKGFSTKGVPLPEKETLWTIFVLLLVLLFGTIDFSVRKPEPKVEIPKLSQELYRGFE